MEGGKEGGREGGGREGGGRQGGKEGGMTVIHILIVTQQTTLSFPPQYLNNNLT